MKLDHYLIACTKFKSKWFKNINVRPETIKFIEQHVTGKLVDTGLDFF